MSCLLVNAFRRAVASDFTSTGAPRAGGKSIVEDSDEAYAHPANHTWDYGTMWMVPVSPYPFRGNHTIVDRFPTHPYPLPATGRRQGRMQGKVAP